MFERVLIANRGEIAVRVERTLRRLGIESVAVYSDGDAGAPHVRGADRARADRADAGGASPTSTIERVIEAALRSGADAVHPGYGFLSERADFAARLRRRRAAFVGPGPEAMELLGDKVARASGAAEAAGVPIARRARAARGSATRRSSRGSAEGGPAAAGQGGGGRRRQGDAGGRRRSTSWPRRSARRGARRLGAFGDDRLLVERYLEASRHLEVQVLADAHGNAVHLGERECSLQRRHQKVIEESPSPVVDAELRERMGAAAVALARHAAATSTPARSS